MKSISHYDSHSFGKGNAKENFKKKKKQLKRNQKDNYYMFTLKKK